jgi:hypothetical protein
MSVRPGLIREFTCPSWALCVSLLAGISLAQGARDAVDFQREVRPILSENCFQCHGPDKATRMANLRLDTREGVFSKRAAGVVVVPSDPKSSLLYQRITHEKAAMRMPPEFSHKTLTEQQKDTLRSWIEQGAPFKEHWAFQAPARSALPAVKAANWPRNPIDHFVLTKLESAGLNPAPEADRRALIRRLSLDLIGLPPTPAEVEAFAADNSPAAYEKLVDRLLASPHYGEHRARYWLDAARYADTHGIHIDNYREMWPYRDWVIAAFNRNMPFDRFTIEQFAGDLLPNHTADQQIATGFHRCNPTTNEGGSLPEEVAAMYAKDRVETTGAVWLGLTIGCATCHDHKFDPIAQREFYQFAAFFRNTTQEPMDGNIPDTPPVVVIPSKSDADRWNEIASEMTAAHAAVIRAREAGREAFEAWLKQRSIDQNPLDKSAEVLTITTDALPESVKRVEGPNPATPGLHFAGKATLNLPAPAVFVADKPFTIAAWALVAGSEQPIPLASQITTDKTAEPNDDDADTPGNTTGLRLDINGSLPQFRLTAGRSTISVRGNTAGRLPPKSWSHLVFTYDGSRGQNGLAIYVNGQRVQTENASGAAELKGEFRNPAPLRIGGNAIADFRVYNRAIRPDEAKLLASWNTIRAAVKDSTALSKPERDALELYYLNRLDRAYMEAAAKVESLEAERRAIRRRGSTTLVMQERTGATPTAKVLYRGQYDQPREEVTPGVPSVLPPMAVPLPRNRLGLAQWIVEPANPLTARVTVNRIWQEIFGTGIVRTAEDFGSQGEAPSHPELLDWLAVEFRDSGWDVKKLIRLIVTSATYRQSAATTEGKLKADPENRLFSRGPRFRMDAEVARDLALAASGLLVDKIGGPSVKPYQPEGIWETVAMKGSNTRLYKQDHGENLYRRSLYTFWKRAAPPPSMEIFNAPTRENCTMRRERTDTPLQALVTMNDPQFVEAARNLAEQAFRGGADVDSRLDFITARVLARPFNRRERVSVKGALKDLLSHYDSEPGQAARLIAVGESKRDPSVPVADLAAWTMVANTVLNLDEALNK